MTLLVGLTIASILSELVHLAVSELLSGERVSERLSAPDVVLDEKRVGGGAQDSLAAQLERRVLASSEVTHLFYFATLIL